MIPKWCYIGITVLLLCGATFADKIVETEDGQKILIRDDGTWTYLTEVKPEGSESEQKTSPESEFKPAPPPSLKNVESQSLPPYSQVITALQLGAHSSLGTNWPFVGAHVIFDRRIPSWKLSKAVETDRQRHGNIGVMGGVEYAFTNLESTVSADLLVVSGVVFAGWDLSPSTTLRLGGGVSYASVDVSVFGDTFAGEALRPTGFGAVTFHPDREKFGQGFALTFAVRSQGNGVMFTISPGFVQTRNE
jgi:hypothetical protein